VHNPSVTLMRTTPEECSAIGRVLAERIASATGPTAVIIPGRGWSMLDAADMPYWDPEADAALVRALRQRLKEAESGGRVEVIEEDAHVNDEAFVRVCVDKLLELMAQKTT
jgi:uncharacterized protein (UPF0261 family)